jgi:tetratricopeptide (TPR) repeat protein
MAIGPRRRRWGAAALVTILCIGGWCVRPAAGGEAAPEGRAGELLAQGKTLLEQGQYAQATELLQQAFREAPGSVAVNFYLGRAAYGAGDYGLAVTAFERILEMKPKLHRVRLELARAYYALGAHERAKEQFQQVLAVEELPATVRQNVERYVGAIEEATRRNLISGRVALTYGHDTNPTVHPEDRSIRTPGGGYLYLDVTTPGSGEEHPFQGSDHFVRFTTFLKHVYRTKLKPLEWRTSFFLNNDWYDDRDRQNNSYYQIKTGPGGRWGRFDVELMAYVNALELDNTTTSKYHGFEVNVLANVTRNFLLGGSLSREMRKWYQNRDRDAVHYTAALRPIFVWGEQGENRLFSEFRWERNYPQEGADHQNRVWAEEFAEEDEYTVHAFSVRYTRDLPWFQLSPYVGFSAKHTSYADRRQGVVANEPAGREWSNTYTFGVTKKLPWDMSLDLSHARTYTDANFPLYEYKRHLTLLTLSKSF